MENLSLLIQNNSTVFSNRISIIDGCFVFKENNSRLGAHTIRNLIGFINSLRASYPNAKLPINLEFQDVTFHDKLTYVLLECLSYYLITDCGYKVSLKFSPNPRIHTDGVLSSPLFLLSTGQSNHMEKFKSRFLFDIFKKHYRRVIPSEKLKNPAFLSGIMDEIAWFQSVFDVDEESKESVSEVIIELVGNASEHGEENCLIDLDIATSYMRKDSNEEVIGINIVVVNFSNQLLGTALKTKILASDFDDGRYNVVRTAYENHSKFFCKDYTEEDFFNITAFQHKISGRHDSILTGGTGLTKLINSLEVRSNAHMCYVLSGRRITQFKQEYLTYSDAGWLGFNQSNDYVSSIPDTSLFEQNKYMFPGTAYNLNFVMKKER